MSDLTQKQLAQAQYDAKRKLWTRGNLSWKFNDYPWAKDLYNFIRSKWGTSPHLDVMIHRRGTKSTTCLIIGIEECLRTPHTSVAVLCTTKDQARNVCEESLTAILEDCPKGIHPRRIKNDFAWVFDHNGSKIQVLAADKLSANAGRGRKFRFIHVMEAGFIEDLPRILGSVLAPTLRDVTGKFIGQMVLESTPSIEEDHPFESLWDAAEADGRAFFLPLSKNKYAAASFVEACKSDYPGREASEDYQREYELKFHSGGSRTAIPEFKEKQAEIVREVPRPPNADRYESLDPGGIHPTGELWGFYDFEKDLLVIEDEWLCEGATTDAIRDETLARERSLWGDSPRGKLLRIADNNNPILLRDLHRDGVTFHATAKDDKDAQINKTRVMFRAGKIAIHPRCTTLIKTLRIAKRAKSKRRGFDEAEGIGHADLLDCLLYMVRNLRKHEIPEQVVEYQVLQQIPRSPEPPKSNAAAQLSKSVFGRRNFGLRRW